MLALGNSERSRKFIFVSVGLFGWSTFLRPIKSVVAVNQNLIRGCGCSGFADETLISASARKPEAGAVCGDAVPFVVATIVVDDPLVDVG